MDCRQQNSYPVVRGRKLVLNYTNGSPCPSVSDNEKRAMLTSVSDDEHSSSTSSDAATGTASGSPPKATSTSSGKVRRKNTIISLLCERDPLMPPLTLSFVGSPDECTYVFEARSNAACAGIEKAKQSLSPGGVFGVIAIIAGLVYFVGGCVYSRTVLNQRGWRQLPNYALWSGIFRFFHVSTPQPLVSINGNTNTEARTSFSFCSPRAHDLCPRDEATTASMAAWVAWAEADLAETARRRTGSSTN